MTVSDHVPAVRNGTRLPTPSDFNDAHRLISDLTALIDAGLISVRQQPHGPARYEAVPEPGDATE